MGLFYEGGMFKELLTSFLKGHSTPSSSRTPLNKDGTLSRPATGEQWLADGKSFMGLIVWELEHHRRLSEGWFIQKFEALAEEDAPFFYPIRHLNPD